MCVTDLPATQTAIVGLETGDIGIAHGVALPRLEDDMIVVKNEAVAINPVDTKLVGKLCTPDAVAGLDFAGKVMMIGSKVRTAADIRVGDRVCGAVQGMHSLTPGVGAFAEYVGATDLVTLKVPDALSYEEAASLGSGIGTIGPALFKSLQVPGTPESPARTPQTALVYGGSSATGTLAIQLLKLSNLHVITTCSPRNFELVKSYGADAVFDYHEPNSIESIRSYTKNSLRYVLDSISEPETMQFCYRCIGRAGGKYTALEPYPEFLHTRPTVQPDWALGPTLLGKPIGWGRPFERDGDTTTQDFTRWCFKLAQKLLDDGQLKLHPLQLMDGGLEGVLTGLELLRKKEVSGRKLVYRLC